MPFPTVAIVGRPNVGKSTLFNRLVGKRLALVDDRPGVTRDRREGDAKLLGLEFRVIDTAGFEDEDPASLPGRMRQQTEAAVRDADAALFLVDAREGLTPLDEEIGRWLRAESTPVIVVANTWLTPATGPVRCSTANTASMRSIRHCWNSPIYRSRKNRHSISEPQNEIRIWHLVAVPGPAGGMCHQ